MKIKSKKIIKVDPTPVYDLTSGEDQNFLLSNGTVVHNCADGLAGAIEAINRDLEAFTFLARPFVQEQYVNHMKSKTVFSKQNIIKDMKKITKSGGLNKFHKKQSEREEFLKGIDFTIPIPSKYKHLDPDKLK